MRNLGLWGGCAVLLLALGVAAASAAPPTDDDDDDSGKAKPVAGPDPAARPRDGWNPFLSRLFGQDDKKPAAKPAKEPDADKKADAPAPRPSARAEIAAQVRALEQAKLRRRQDVCLRLREIARDTQDEELERKALQLDQLAFEVYQERILRLAGGASGEEPLGQQVPSGSSAASRPNAAGTTDSGSTASVREVRP